MTKAQHAGESAASDPLGWALRDRIPAATLGLVSALTSALTLALALALSLSSLGCGSTNGAETSRDGGGGADALVGDGGDRVDAESGAGDAGTLDAGTGDGGTGPIEPPPCDQFSSPQGGGTGADGSQLHPWASLETLAAEGKIPTSGTLCLMNGHHGQPQIHSLAASPWVTIRAVNRHQAVVSALSLTAVSNLTLSGLKVDGDPRISNVTIRHNRFILFADPMTSFVLDNDLVGTLMQGVIITDGYADGWVVENNLIVNSREHGISLYGCRNCRVQNNTVVAHPAFAAGVGPWIRISDQTKTGQANFNNVIRNNLAQMLTPWDYDVTSLVEANLEISAADDHFVDAAGLDFHLVPTSAAVNAGVSADLSALDLDGLPRVVGSAVDIGAFELP